MSNASVTDVRNKAPEVVLSTSDEAATIRTVTGWVSRNGRFWGDDERIARYDGCTHGVCECGATMEKHWTKCEACRNASALERFAQKPRADWDGSTPLYSDAAERYFFCNSELADFIEDEYEGDIESLRLVICEPNHARPLDPDNWADDLPEDGDLPDELEAAIKALNEIVRTLEPLSWSAGKYVASIDSVRGATETVPAQSPEVRP